MNSKANKSPNYKQIYTDILNIKYPSKKKTVVNILRKQKLSAIDILELNKRIFGEADNNQKYRSYSKSDVLQILDYQKKYSLNNTQLALHFRLSRNTIAKWRQQFMI